MRVLFGLQQREPSPGPRYRVTQFIPRFEAAGVQCDVLIAQGAHTTRASMRSVSLSVPARAIHLAWAWVESQLFLVRLLRRVRRYDRCYLYRVPISGWATLLLKAHRNHLVYDFDDAIDVEEGTGSVVERLRQRVWSRGLRQAVRCCHIIVTSNDRNATAVTRLGGRAVVVPTSVEVGHYPENHDAGASPRRRFTLGWIGTPSTSRYLPALEPALLAVAKTHEIDVRLVGASESPFRELPVTLRPWSLETETREIAAFDVGLMPMPDTAWTRGKAALKALQYGAAGIPTVASWTPTNEEILGPDGRAPDGGGTLYGRTPDEWRDALGGLLADAALRQELGARAQRRVEAHYSVAANFPKLLAVLRA